MGQSFGLGKCGWYDPDERGARLGLAMDVMTVMVTVVRGGEGRSSKHHDQQSCSDDLFHGLNVARCRL